jgi:hypothetical protein
MLFFSLVCGLDLLASRYTVRKLSILVRNYCQVFFFKVCQRNKTLDREVEERNVATDEVSAICAMNGAAIQRVHDMERTVQAVRMSEAIIVREYERVQRRDDQRVNISFPIGPRLARRRWGGKKSANTSRKRK